MVIKITQVTTESEYNDALLVIDYLINSATDSEKEAELDRIADLVIEYEAKHYPIENSDPKSMVEFMIDQRMITTDRVLELLDGDVSVDSLIAGEYKITPQLAQMLHEKFGVPVEYLLQTTGEGD